MNSNEEDPKDSDSDNTPTTNRSTEDHQNKKNVSNNEEPNFTIEKILIGVYNGNINNQPNKDENKYISECKQAISKLCINHEYNILVYSLLLCIKKIIEKYKEKIFETKEISELRKYYLDKVNKISLPTNIEEKNNEEINFDKNPTRYLNNVKTLFSHLITVQKCLQNSAKKIEEIFEEPLSKFKQKKDFSILEFEKEEFYSIILHDEYILYEITNNKNNSSKENFSEIQNQINILQKESYIDTSNKKSNIMNEIINYFINLSRARNIYNKHLLMAKIGSSIDERYPEDATPYIIEESDDDYEIQKAIYFQEDEEEGENNNNNINIINNTNDKRKKLIAIKDIRNNNKYDFKSELQEETQHNIIYSAEGSKKRYLENFENKNEETNEKNKRKNRNKNKEIFNNIEDFKENSKFNNNKIEKKEVPSDIDELLKFIKSDDKIQPSKKKKKRNKKNKKKNKNKADEDEDKKEENEEKEDIMINDDEEFIKFKNDIELNSINRYKIHKIKFKYKSDWLTEIIKNSNEYN